MVRLSHLNCQQVQYVFKIALIVESMRYSGCRKEKEVVVSFLRGRERLRKGTVVRKKYI